MTVGEPNKLKKLSTYVDLSKETHLSKHIYIYKRIQKKERHPTPQHIIKKGIVKDYTPNYSLTRVH